MDGFKKTLEKESYQVRGVIEAHVRRQMGLDVPSRTIETQTFTYNRLYDNIKEEIREEVEKLATDRAAEFGMVKFARMQKEIDMLLETKNKQKDKLYEL